MQLIIKKNTPIHFLTKRSFSLKVINVYVDDKTLAGTIIDNLLNLEYKLIFDKSKAKNNALNLLPSQTPKNIEINTYVQKSRNKGINSFEIIDLQRLNFLITYTLFSKKLNNNTKKTILSNINFIKKNIYFCNKTNKMLMQNSYTYLTELKAGRLYTNVGIFSLPRKFRNYLAFGNYLDYDIKNCHFVLMQSLAKQQELKHENLAFFNENRFNILNELSFLNNINYNTVKIDLIIKLNGGAFKFLKEFGNFQKLIKDLYLEVTNIREFFSKNLEKTNPDIFRYLQNSSFFKKKTLFKQKITIQSILCQTLESQALCILYKQVLNYNKNTSFIACYDGALIQRDTAEFFTINHSLQNNLKEGLSSANLENVEFGLKSIETNELLLFDTKAYVVSLLLNQKTETQLNKGYFSFKNRQNIEQLTEGDRLIAYNQISRSINDLSIDVALNKHLISENFLNIIDNDSDNYQSRLNAGLLSFKTVGNLLVNEDDLF